MSVLKQRLSAIVEETKEAIAETGHDMASQLGGAVKDAQDRPQPPRKPVK